MLGYLKVVWHDICVQRACQDALRVLMMCISFGVMIQMAKQASDYRYDGGCDESGNGVFVVVGIG